VDLTAPDAAAGDRLAGFSPATVEWFRTTFGAPTEAQARAWPSIRAGGHTLLCAPTGSGKTLAAFLAAIDRLSTSTTEPAGHTSVVYLSPLRALAVDVEKNLRSPLRGIALAAERLGLTPRADGRHPHRRHPGRRAPPARPQPAGPADHHARVAVPDAHLGGAGDAAFNVEAVIIDEIHAVAATKRGSAPRGHPGAPRRLRASGRPSASACRPRSGPSRRSPLPRRQRGRLRDRATERGPPRPVTIVDAGTRKPLDLRWSCRSTTWPTLGTEITTRWAVRRRPETVRSGRSGRPCTRHCSS
jgi:ATP-dependent Lhr-like helicase